ncbi:hypothetical protein DUI87_03780 [Hirundo rustica rustica]|uniref:Uncharacterized protein n=1 Tax=Hirundo rustica rustica TaxID=333673 RepID=A0A3M0L267_HIRRU|nr:hypothetical protein DUI87_03780 [Hirundo rustica rustica]
MDPYPKGHLTFPTKRGRKPIVGLVDSQRELEHFSAEDKVKKLGRFSLKKRLHGDLIVSFQYLKGAYSEVREKGLFIMNCRDGMRRKGFKLREEEFRFGIQKKFFIVMLVRHCNKLPREVVDTPSLEVFRPDWMGIWAA